MKAREINNTIRYTMWSVFRYDRSQQSLSGSPAEIAESAWSAVNEATEGGDLTIRGWYDVAGLRADADLMVWWHAPTSETLQDAYHALRRSDLGQSLVPVWSQLALHRPAEFNKGHVPAFMQDEEAKAHVCVYPFVRSYEWYLLPEDERRALLAEHGAQGRDFPQVLSNTVAAFALGDYEWLLALEADELVDLTDLMRHLRGSGARRHVRLEVPFFTGHRISPSDLPRVLR